MDLPSTLLRAQALFRRFQRTVDAIDKKKNFPAPSVRQRKITDKAAKPAAGGTKTPPLPKRRASTGDGAASSSAVSSNAVGKARAREETNAVEEDTEKEQVISPELRGLLSRKVIILNKETGSEGAGRARR